MPRMHYDIHGIKKKKKSFRLSLLPLLPVPYLTLSSPSSICYGYLVMIVLGTTHLVYTSVVQKKLSQMNVRMSVRMQNHCTTCPSHLHAPVLYKKKRIVACGLAVCMAYLYIYKSIREILDKHLFSLLVC
jgi:hypothetical protein